MTTKALTPQETRTALTAEGGPVYIDVRTVAEFAAGHPRGRVVNIPILFRHPTTNEMLPNASFLQVAEDLYAKETPLVIGCETGPRAEQAAAQLKAVGYTDVAVMRGGFSEWRAQGLPDTADNRPGVSYVSLLTKVKRKGKKKAAAHA